MAEAEKMSLVMFSGDLDRALAGFMLANTGASMGMEVSMFFTFWGLNIIKKDEGVRSRGLMKRMLNFMNRGGTRRLKMSKFHMMGMGTGMMKGMMKDLKIPSIEEFMAMAKAQGVKIYACTTSCGLMGLDASAFRSEVDEMVGAAFFLGEARKSKISLFI